MVPSEFNKVRYIPVILKVKIKFQGLFLTRIIQNEKMIPEQSGF